MNLSIISDQISQDIGSAFSIIAQEGYKEVELHNVFGHSIETCNQEEIVEIKSLLKKYNLQVSNIASTIFFLCPLYPNDKVSLFNPDFHCIEGNVHKHLEILRNACHIAKELNCSLIRIFPFRWPDNRKGPYGTQQDYEQILDNIQKAVQIAQLEDCTLVLENCPYSHLPKGEMTLKVIREINSPYLKLLWDPANSYRAIQDNVPLQYRTWSLEKELNELFPYIGHIHLKDYHYDNQFEKPFRHVAIGDGDIDYENLILSLRKLGYNGSLSLEPEVNQEDTLKSMETVKLELE